MDLNGWFTNYQPAFPGHKMALRLDQELSKDERAAIMADIEEEKQKKLQVPSRMYVKTIILGPVKPTVWTILLTYTSCVASHSWLSLAASCDLRMGVPGFACSCPKQITSFWIIILEIGTHSFKNPARPCRKNRSSSRKSSNPRGSWWPQPDFRCRGVTSSSPWRQSYFDGLSPILEKAIDVLVLLVLAQEEAARGQGARSTKAAWMNGWMAGWSMIWGVNQQF